ncbi:SIR2 family protein [Ruminococcus sp.]|uniref:SIR2 family protein n=1 Tax=Ruminococcus sp. TaxID=41978 RepID=UPI001B446490|nr:SIR2 family protein [Ruminococcus sp.]MBP5432489.1 SIR2 family protein [Ruminococcus sp.]
MAVTKEELIREYTRAIQEGNAAIFAGAGLSRPSGFVDWKGLLKPLADSINLDVNKEHDLLSVAQYYRNRRGTRTSINQAIMNAFSKDVTINENVRIVTRLPIFTYWTTNYDEIVENGIKAANRNPDVKSESEQLPVIKPDRDAIVYKMHGDVNNPAKAVLTKEDYDLYENHRPLFRTALQGDLVSKVFLFIGFSFEDPNIDYILSQIRSLLGENISTHYCFFKRVQQSDYTDLEEYGYNKAKQDLQEENLRNYGIQTVFVNEYDEITEILRDLEKNYKMKKVFISGSADAFSDPWSKEKAEELAGKLAGILVRNDCRITSGFGLGIGSAVINGALDVIYTEKYRHIDEHLCLRPFPQNISNPTERAEKWKKYREEMLAETGVSIFMFGNKKDATTGSIIEANGCMQEFEIAKSKGNIIIPIGSTGYTAKTILENVKKDMANYHYLSKYIDILETETDIDKLIQCVIEIIQSNLY